MRLSIKTKIILAFLIVTLINTAFILGYLQFYFADKLKESVQVANNLHVQSQKTMIEKVAELYPDSDDIETFIQHEAEQNDVQIKVSDLKGNEWIVTEYKNKDVSIIHSKEIVVKNGQAVYIMEFRYPDPEFLKQMMTYRGQLFWVIAIIIISTLSLILYLQRSIVTPLTSLHTHIKMFHLKNMKIPVLKKRKDEIGELFQHFEAMGNRLDTSHKEQTHMIEALSHDIKTPLTSILGYIQRLSAGKIQSETKKADYYQIIYRKAKDIEKMVEDFATFSDMEQNKMKVMKERVNVQSFFHSICTEYSEELEVHHVGFEWCCDVTDSFTVLMDTKEIRRVFANTVQNVLMYVQTPVEVKMYCGIKDGEAFFSIEDNGDGVPEEEIQRIFERFYRVEKSRSRSSGGSGLGLATCKSIIQAHGGEIKAYRNEYGGLGISFTLPG